MSDDSSVENEINPAPAEPERARVELTLDITPGSVVRVTVTALEGETPQVSVTQVDSSDATLPPPPPAVVVRSTPVKERKERRPLRLPHFNAGWLLGMVFLIYAVTRLAGLGSFPSHFSCDESISNVRASDLIANGFKDGEKILLPTFVKNDGQYSLGATVYLQILPNILFRPSLYSVRAFTALLSILGAWWLYLILRDFFKLRLPWLSVLLMAAAPAWLLLSRTGLEAPQMVVFYIGFLYYYLRYRAGESKMLLVSLGLGILTFYTYTPGQIIITLSGLLLLISDAPYHWKQRKIALVGLGIIILGALPLVRFWIGHPSAYTDRLAMYNSALSDLSLSTSAKIGAYFKTYIAGLDPAFWFLPNEHDHIKYLMGPHANLPGVYFPLTLWGLWLSLRRWRQPASRATWVALLTAPAASALASPSVPRMLTFVIPVIILTTLALENIIDWLVRRVPKLSPRIIEALLFIVLAASGIGLFSDSLQNGSRWYNRYGLDGLQWGAPQVYAAANNYLRAHPDLKLYVSPNWTFQGEEVRRFFTDNSNIVIHGYDEYLASVKSDLNSLAFVLTAKEYEAARESGKLDPITVDQVIHYPDGKPGFYFVRMQYAPNIEQIFRAEADKFKELVEATWKIGEMQVSGHTSQLDVGPVDNAFDGNLDSLIRTAGSNPLVIEIIFDQPQTLHGIQARLGSETVQLTTIVTPVSGEPRSYTTQQGGTESFKDLPLEFGETLSVQSLRIEIYDVNSPEPVNVHLWEITFLHE